MASALRVGVKLKSLIFLLAVSAAVQVSLFILISKYLTSLGISEAIGALDEVAHAGEFPVFLIDPSQLRILNNDYSLTFDDSKTYNRPVSFAFDCSLLNGSDHLYRKAGDYLLVRIPIRIQVYSLLNFNVYLFN